MFYALLCLEIKTNCLRRFLSYQNDLVYCTTMVYWVYFSSCCKLSMKWCYKYIRGSDLLKNANNIFYMGRLTAVLVCCFPHDPGKMLHHDHAFLGICCTMTSRSWEDVAPRPHVPGYMLHHDLTILGRCCTMTSRSWEDVAPWPRDLYEVSLVFLCVSYGKLVLNL